LTTGEKAFLESLEGFFDEQEWLTNAKAREIAGKTEGSVKRYLRNLSDKGIFETQGENKRRQYRLRKK
jgi:Fic family protein